MEKVFSYFQNKIIGKEWDSLIINGEAGTGKTYMICYFVAIMNLLGVKIAVATYTAKAYEVINQKIFSIISEINSLLLKMNFSKLLKYMDFVENCMTLHSFFNINKN